MKLYWNDGPGLIAEDVVAGPGRAHAPLQVRVVKVAGRIGLIGRSSFKSRSSAGR